MLMNGVLSRSKWLIIVLLGCTTARERAMKRAETDGWHCFDDADRCFCTTAEVMKLPSDRHRRLTDRCTITASCWYNVDDDQSDCVCFAASAGVTEWDAEIARKANSEAWFRVPQCGSTL